MGVGSGVSGLLGAGLGALGVKVGTGVVIGASDSAAVGVTADSPGSAAVGVTADSPAVGVAAC